MLQLMAGRAVGRLFCVLESPGSRGTLRQRKATPATKIIIKYSIPPDSLEVTDTKFGHAGGHKVKGFFTRDN